ncbi:unnamed protein product [Brachionus calyciflorus]|uniref:CGG triplet repeat-binding protein 1 n=1 Tax=Brachionus calyciflorus TaxID=104777 RepID=A0A814R1S6_9BILA|nr:unnamed protein product [Brachionus calyciflorus]
MPNKPKTALSRVKEYGKDFVEKNNEHFCAICSIKINFSRKSSIEQHLKTAIHKKNSEKIKNKNSLNQSLINLDAEQVKEAFARDLLEAFTSAKIPLNKLENESVKNLFKNT